MLSERSQVQVLPASTWLTGSSVGQSANVPFPILVRLIPYAPARKSLMTGSTPVSVWQTFLSAHTEGWSAANCSAVSRPRLAAEQPVSGCRLSAGSIGEWGNGSPTDSKSVNPCSIRGSPAIERHCRNRIHRLRFRFRLLTQVCLVFRFRLYPLLQALLAQLAEAFDLRSNQ